MNSREGDAQSHNTADSVSRAHSYGKLVAFFAARAMWWLLVSYNFSRRAFGCAKWFHSINHSSKI